MTHQKIIEITNSIISRSQKTRQEYLNSMQLMESEYQTRRHSVGDTNLAHACAAMELKEKLSYAGLKIPNIAIISAYNDMLSAHQPYKNFPDIIKNAARNYGATAQFAGGVPAMCDGITQGNKGMELSLLSRDTIARAASIALSHEVFDGAIFLGICDKIVPGLMIAAMCFGYLPIVFIPSGPMPTGISNSEKAKIRQLYTQEKISRDELLKSEMQSYHSAGTCTFYGTANSNQMLMEIMGLHLPSSSFIPPNTPLRDALTIEATKQLIENIKIKKPLYKIIDEKTFVNAIIGLLATGGSTNLTIHLIAMAKAAGIIINWDDFNDLAKFIPLLARVYPNGEADVNHFHHVGGVSFIIHELCKHGLMHSAARCVYGDKIENYNKEAFLNEDNSVIFKDCITQSADETILRPVNNPFDTHGGLILMQGNLGRAICKVSAIPQNNRIVKAPALIFHNQQEFQQAFKDNKLNRDFVAVIRFQGAKANGMPELHKLTPPLAVLQDKGFKVALVTDGRMSGASGKVPAAIHVTPEATMQGMISKIQEGDIIIVDTVNGILNVDIEENILKYRSYTDYQHNNTHIIGQNLFKFLQQNISSAEEGATSF